MGEIADMMIGGDLCEGCGVAMEDPGYGVPRYCSSSCARDRGHNGIHKDGTPKYSNQPKTGEQSINRNLSLKLHYNGELVYSFKDEVESDPETKHEVMKLAEMLMEEFSFTEDDDPQPDSAKHGGSVITWIEQNKIKKEKSNDQVQRR